MDIHIPLRPQSLPQAVLSAGARVVGLIYSGARSILLVGPGGSGKTLTLDIVLDGMPGTVHRVVNHGAGPLGLGEILLQLGVECGHAPGRDALVRALAEPGRRPVVLAVDDAQSLTREAALALAVLTGVRSEEGSAIVILAGTPALRAVLARRGLRTLRGRDATVTLPAPAGSAEGRGRTLLGLPRRRVTVGGALAACALSVAVVMSVAPRGGVPEGAAEPAQVAGLEPAAGVAVVVATGATAAPSVREPDAVAAAPVVEQGRVEPGRVEQGRVEQGRVETARVEAGRVEAGRAEAGRVEAAAMPVPPSDAQLRLEFGAFLNRAGPDTARLPAARREALFAEYLAWRGRGAEAGRR